MLYVAHLFVLFVMQHEVICNIFDPDISPNRIVNGDPVPKGERRFQVAIIKNGSLLCGGSLVSMRHVLTAAHCAYKINASELFIRYGTYRYLQGDMIRINQSYLHPNFEMINMYDDIAILELSSSIPNRSDVEIVSLSESETPKGTTVLVSGWGDVKADEGPSNVLLWTSLVAADRNECKLTWSASYEVTDNVFCAKTTSKEGSFCHGDSGGPLTLTNGTLVGIVSITFPDCSATEHPNLFTNVWKYNQWIDKTIRITPDQ